MEKAIESQWDSLSVGGKKMPVYLCEPRDPGRHPTVILLQEIFGVNHHIRSVTERIARQGYRALAPDLFYRQGEHFEGDYSDIAGGRARAEALQETDFLADMEHLLNSPCVLESRSVGVTGFCMGGRLTYLLACSQKVDAAACFYGGRTAATVLSKTPGIRCPMLLFYGGKDEYIPLSEVKQIETTLRENGKQAEVIVYPEADHGFLCDERGSYHASSAKDAWAKLLAFFSKNLSDGE